MAANPSRSSNKSDIASEIADSQADPVKKGFSDRLRLKLVESGLSDAHFARAANVSTSSLSGYKAGKNIPNAVDLFALADALRLHPRWLMYGDAPGGVGLVAANQADWVQIPRFKLVHLTETGKGQPIENIPYRKDWLNRRLGGHQGLWITELPSDYDALGLEEADAVLCSDIDTNGPHERWVCLFGSEASRPFVARYSNRGSSELDAGSSIVSAADLRGHETFPIARIRARMLARV